MLTIANFVNGRFVAPVSGQTFAKTEPATGAVVAQVPDSDERDVALAVEAATDAFRNWSRTPVAERAGLLLAMAQVIEQRLATLAEVESRDTGKPLKLAKTVDIPRAASNFRFFASAIQQFHTEAYRTDQLALNYTLRQPRGAAGVISPWNLPLYLFSWKVAPALASGNTVVAKPSELTPTTANLLAGIAQEVGLPPGVFNVLHGYGNKVGAAIVVHPRVPTISFTGGTATGGAIARSAAPLFKKVALEMGGKNPNIIFADADFDEALKTTLRSSFENQGEICLCGSRIFVEASLYPAFIDRFVEAARRLKVGDPLDPAMDLGALISRAHFDKVMSYIQLAKTEGGRILCGGGPPKQVSERCKNGVFVEPTVIVDLDVNCRVNQEEIFGPVVTVTPFDTEEEVIRHANDTPYGLSASLWTQNVSRAHRVAEHLDCGTVWVNCWLVRDLRTPFGGTKSSGIGREGGEEALRFYTEPKTVCIKY